MGRYWVFVLAVAAAFAVPALAEEDCRLELAATLPLDVHDGVITVPAAIGDTPLKMIVDTGSPTSVIRESIAKKLNLRYEMLKYYQSTSIFGGVHMYRYSNVPGFTLGKLRGDGVAMTWLPENDLHDWPQDGLLGANVLGVYDVDFDFAKATMHLFAPHRCPGRVVYWTQDESVIARVPIDFHGSDIRIPVEIDGHKIRAVLDTGANTTVMDQETFMPLFGLTPTSPGVEMLHDTRDPYPEYLYTFKTINIQGVIVNNARVIFISQKFSHSPDYDMLVGTNILMHLHLYIAYKEKMLFATAATAH